MRERSGGVAGDGGRLGAGVRRIVGLGRLARVGGVIGLDGTGGDVHGESIGGIAGGVDARGRDEPRSRAARGCDAWEGWAVRAVRGLRRGALAHELGVDPRGLVPGGRARRGGAGAVTGDPPVARGSSHGLSCVVALTDHIGRLWTRSVSGGLVRRRSWHSGRGTLRWFALGVGLVLGCRPAPVRAPVPVSATPTRPAVVVDARPLAPAWSAEVGALYARGDAAALLATGEPFHMARAGELLAAAGDVAGARDGRMRGSCGAGRMCGCTGSSLRRWRACTSTAIAGSR